MSSVVHMEDGTDTQLLMQPDKSMVPVPSRHNTNVARSLSLFGRLLALAPGI